MTIKETLKTISIAHSVDADDAFMFYALAQNIILSKDFVFSHVLKDIQTLNSEALENKYDVQAISFSVYPDIEDKYQLLSCGGSLGYGYGPTVIANGKITIHELKSQKIAIPGVKTTAYLLLKLLLGDFNYEFVPFDKIISRVSSCEFKCGLIIHEGQLSYESHNLYKVVDLGDWWLEKTGLPVPLGGNVIKRTFENAEKKEINSLIRKSIKYALDHKHTVIPCVSKYARDIKNDNNLVDKFVSMYVNEFTVDYGEKGKKAIQTLYKMALEQELIKKMPRLDFVE